MSTDPRTGAVSVPIYQVSTYKQSSPGQHMGYEYSRTGNPTREALERLIADLEEGVAGFAFSSGMAAMSSVIMLFKSGDHLIVSDNVYGGTFRVIDKIFVNLGIEYTLVDTTNLEEVEKAIRLNTKGIFIETPTNPLLKITDISAVSKIAQTNNLLLIVDNTFMTPYLQRPIALGADIVVHSATKYLGGHSDLVAGLVVVKDEELGERLHFVQNSVGAILGPQDSWLLMRGIKTLGVRMERHQENAQRIANWLKEQKQVIKVYYPGLKEHPGYEINRKQASGPGGMISFEVESPKLARKILERVKMIALAESLGGVESLISLPALMTHASIPKEDRIKLGISDALIRLSVGIEDCDDLIADLGQAMKGGE
nr:bifunctional cystathionine gamma-lyase/homocysteine desulfhydrase [Anoxybacter fermentans]